MSVRPSRPLAAATLHRCACRLAISVTVAIVILLRLCEVPTFAQAAEPDDGRQPVSSAEPFVNPAQPTGLNDRAETSGLRLWQAALLGAVEGATEFLPVSSTGHLILAQKLMGLDGSAEDAKAASSLAICIQGGAIVAVALIYWRRLSDVALGLIGRSPSGKRLAANLVIAFLPAALLGVLLHDAIKESLFGVGPVAIALFVGGVLMLATAKRLQGGRESGGDIAEMTARQALLIGVMQCLALFPGFSRSLATILGGVWVGLRLESAVEFSFLLGLLTLTAATVFEAAGSGAVLLDHYGATSLAVSFLTALIAAFLSIRFMVGTLTSLGLAPFGYYRIALAIACLALV